MIKYILKRFLLMCITLFVLLSIVYLLVASFSKNPFLVGGGNIDNADNLAAANGLKDPILVRYWNYFSGFFTGNFGKIYNPPGEIHSIPELFFGPLRWTLLITVPAMFFAIIIGVSLGVVAGYNRGKLIDTLINIFVVIFIGLPSFVIAPLILLIASSSNGLIISQFYLPDQQGWFITIKSAILPIITVLLGSLASYTILVRNQVITALTSNHVLIAQSKGLSQWDIFWKHIIRNISIPLLSFIVPSFIVLLAGNIVIEQFFGVPGTSTIIINSFPKGEINVVMFSIFFFAGISMLSEIILDISYIFIDPKIKFFETTKKSWTKNLVNEYKRKKEFKNRQTQEIGGASE